MLLGKKTGPKCGVGKVQKDNGIVPKSRKVLQQLRGHIHKIEKKIQSAGVTIGQNRSIFASTFMITVIDYKPMIKTGNHSY